MASTLTRRRSHPASAARSSKGSRPCVSRSSTVHIFHLRRSSRRNLVLLGKTGSQSCKEVTESTWPGRIATCTSEKGMAEAASETQPHPVVLEPEHQASRRGVAGARHGGVLQQ